MTNSDSKQRTDLEQRAHVAQSRLVGVIDALDRRRRAVRKASIGLVDLAVPVALGVSFFIAYRASVRKQRRTTLHIQFGGPQRPSWLRDIVRTGAAVALVLGVSKVAERALPKLLPPKSSSDDRHPRQLPP